MSSPDPVEIPSLFPLTWSYVQPEPPLWSMLRRVHGALRLAEEPSLGLEVWSLVMLGSEAGTSESVIYQCLWGLGLRGTVVVEGSGWNLRNSVGTQEGGTWVGLTECWCVWIPVFSHKEAGTGDWSPGT